MMYNDFAAAFARTRKKSWPDIQEVLSIIQNKGYSNLGRVIDIGCGSGRLAGLLENFDEYVGVDLSDGLLDIAKSNFPQHRFELCEMEKISSLELSKFDTVFFVASFHHLLDSQAQTQVLAQVKDLLSRHGIVVLLNWNLRNEKNSIRYQDNWISKTVLDIPFGGHSRYYYAFELDELQDIFEACGFELLYHRPSSTGDNFLSILKRK